jgi:hypothetical protein
MISRQEPAREDVIRRRLRPDEVQLYNVTRIEVSNSGPFAYQQLNADDFGRLISGTSSGRLWLRLENQFDQGAAAVFEQYDLTFRVYSPDQLASVDDLFVSLLARADPSVALVDEYLRQASMCGAVEYSSALGEYVLAVLNKDNDPASGVRPGLQDYRRKLNSALRTLKEFDRPLARLVSALVRFSSNDFGYCYQTGLESLDVANRQLLPATRYVASIEEIEVPTLPKGEPKRVPVVPIDNGSDSVMRWADQLEGVTRWSEGIAGRLRAETEAHWCDPLDRAKLYVLWAKAAHRIGKFDAASEALRLLLGNDCFGTWAEALLMEIE